MLKYVDRRKTNSSKWDGLKTVFQSEDLLPLWVADMDFKVCDCVLKKLDEYLKFGVFGYYVEPKQYKESFIKWEQAYHNYKVHEDWIRYSPGVVPAINWLI
jgi:cystathionine beta-lyase